MLITGVSVEKVRQTEHSSGCEYVPAEFSSLSSLSGGGKNRGYWSAEEAHESLDVLGHRGEEELLPHELQSPQPQATQSDLMLQFREQGFYLLSLPLGMGELGRVRQLP